MFYSTSHYCLAPTCHPHEPWSASLHLVFNVFLKRTSGEVVRVLQA